MHFKHLVWTQNIDICIPTSNGTPFDILVGPLKYFTPNIDNWALFDHEKKRCLTHKTEEIVSGTVPLANIHLKLSQKQILQGRGWGGV